jgi:preprotein translocase subunit SecA
MLGIAQRLFGTVNDRTLRAYRGQIEAINRLEKELEGLSDEALRACTTEFRARLDQGTRLDDLLVPAFATVREAAKRTIGQRHYDVQLIGGIVLHEGRIAEMATGEGKTLVATLPVYLNALARKGVHVVTVNEYLARRDAAWMGQIYGFLGLTVGCIVNGLDDAVRREQYGSDVTYGTNNEFGFDYLRDNMKFSLETMVQREFNYAIVDEVDSILIDEARTPLIISGPAEDSSELYRHIDAVIPELIAGDFEKDEKSRAVSLTDAGVERLERRLGELGVLKGPNLYDYENVSVVHHVNQALRAHKMFERDRDYIVRDNKVVIIDEFTGRMMPGRRFSEGLHQALEAKERVRIQPENQTLASITFQNYFRLYPKLAGMTGTAATEAAEFGDIYRLEVSQIPTNLPCVRKDHDDEVYRSGEEKWKAILEEIRTCRAAGQPVLVGTTSIEKSEQLSERLKKANITHTVLNARYHEQEAHIVAQAGRLGAVTIATNMAGRGTDIQLGGNIEFRIQDELAALTEPEPRRAAQAKIRAEVLAEREKVKALGGLYVIGSERHEARRIDNQLRGRSGRQGDPGRSKFFLSLEDDLLRIFGGERMDGILSRLGLKEGEAIIHPWINKALEKAQQKVEARNYEIRKNLLKFDDVMNDQRKVIYEQRKELMRASSVSDTVIDMRTEVVDDLIDSCIPEQSYAEEWNLDKLGEEVRRLFNLPLPVKAWAAEDGIADQELRERILEAVNEKMAKKVETYGAEIWQLAEKSMLLQLLDQSWKDHLLALDHLRQGIGLRAYAQRDPLNEYKREAFDMFDSLLRVFRERVSTILAHLELRLEGERPAGEGAQPAAPIVGTLNRPGQPAAAAPAVLAGGGGAALGGAAAATAPAPAKPVVRRDDPATWVNTARNANCPCGSGKKYKHCHGKLG